jgi:hypothetical protein
MEEVRIMRKFTLGYFSLMTAILLIVMSCTNVSAGTEQHIGDLETIVEDLGDCTATFNEDGAVNDDGNDQYSISLSVGDGRFHFYVPYTYEDNHASGQNTGEHTFRMSGIHYTNGTTYCCDRSHGVSPFKTNGGDSGGGTIANTWAVTSHINIGDTVVLTITAACSDLSDPSDNADVSPVVTVTITA